MVSLSQLPLMLLKKYGDCVFFGGIRDVTDTNDVRANICFNICESNLKIMLAI